MEKTEKEKSLGQKASSNSKAIVAQESTDLQVFDPEKDVERARKAAKALMGIIEQKPKKVVMNGETYLEFEDWQTIAQFFNHTVGTDKTEEVLKEGKNWGWQAKSLLYNRDGVVIGGAEASCLRDEPNWTSKPSFQLKSMAQTRAMAKALRSRFGFVAVLAGFKATPAEELNGEEGTPLAPRPASDKQKSFIRSLIDQKKAKGIKDADIEKLSSDGAKKVIDQLLKLPNLSEVVDYEKEPFPDKSKIVNGEIVIEREDMPA